MPGDADEWVDGSCIRPWSWTGGHLSRCAVCIAARRLSGDNLSRPSRFPGQGDSITLAMGRVCRKTHRDLQGQGRTDAYHLSPDRGNGDDRNRRVGHSDRQWPGNGRSEEHTSELQTLMRTSYAVSCFKK